MPEKMETLQYVIKPGGAVRALCQEQPVTEVT